MMSNYRYYIWKNCKIVSDCQRISTVLNRLNKLCKKSNPNTDIIYYTDTKTGVTYDASELIPDFIPNGKKVQSRS